MCYSYVATFHAMLTINHLHRYYVESNGEFRYGYPIPDDALLGSTAYANGTFTYEGYGWLACPIDGAGPGQRFRIFVQLPGLFFTAICFPFEAIATPYESGKIPFVFTSRPWNERAIEQS